MSPFIFEIEARTCDEDFTIALWVETPENACSISPALSSRLAESSSIASCAWLVAGAGGAPSPSRLPTSAWFAEVIASDALAKSACESAIFALVPSMLPCHDATPWQRPTAQPSRELAWPEMVVPPLDPDSPLDPQPEIAASRRMNNSPLPKFRRPRKLVTHASTPLSPSEDIA